MPNSHRGTAEQPLTAREIAERVLAAANVAKPDAEAVRDLTGSIHLGFNADHNGKGIERTNDGAPARWKLKEAAH